VEEASAVPNTALAFRPQSPKANLMDKSNSRIAKQIAGAATALQQQMTGRPPSAVTVVLSEDAVIITLRGILSPAETALAKSGESAARLRELHRNLFTTASEPLRRQIMHITGIDVREASAEVDTSTGTAVQVFGLVQGCAC
jgi:uncharacterized protein YbcI